MAEAQRPSSNRCPSSKYSRGPTPEGRRLSILSWCLFDWANSSFSTVVVTFVFATYFTQAVAESPVAGTAQWGQASSVAAFVVALASPVLGAIADKSGRRKPWLATFTATCVVATCGLWFVTPSLDRVSLALGLFVVASIAFDFSIVFYDAMLPGLTPRERLGRVSGWGWGLGYAGGLSCLAISLLAFVQSGAPWLGLDTGNAEHVRATAFVVAAWFTVFSLPLFLFTPDRPTSGIGLGQAARAGIAMLGDSLRKIGRHRGLPRFLIAHMLYINGFTTLFAFGGVYAAGTFAMPLDEVIRFGIALNVAAGTGAFLFAWITDLIGAKRTIEIALLVLTLVGAALVLTGSKQVLWTLGMVLGLFLGPAQAASRSLMAALAPRDMETEMFGLYALSGKATAFLGPAALALATQYFDSQRAGMATILFFFVSGLVVLRPLVDPALGRR